MLVVRTPRQLLSRSINLLISTRKYWHEETSRSVQRFFEEARVISCVGFIPAYSELFKFLERKGRKSGRPVLPGKERIMKNTHR